MSWDEAFDEAYASAPADSYVVCTLELIHPAFVDPNNDPDSIRISLDDMPWDLELEVGAPLFGGQIKTFEPLAVSVKLPAQEENSLGKLDLAIDNVPRTVLPHLQKAAKIRASALVIYREHVAIRDINGAYSVSGPPDMIIDKLTMKTITATRLRLEGQAGFVDMLNKAFPRRTFNMVDWPGLFAG